jgi:hypothetical protein
MRSTKHLIVLAGLLGAVFAADGTVFHQNQTLVATSPTLLARTLACTMAGGEVCNYDVNELDCAEGSSSDGGPAATYTDAGYTDGGLLVTAICSTPAAKRILPGSCWSHPYWCFEPIWCQAKTAGQLGDGGTITSDPP